MTRVRDVSRHSGWRPIVAAKAVGAAVELTGARSWLLAMSAAVHLVCWPTAIYAAPARDPLREDAPTVEIVLTEYAYGPANVVVPAGTIHLRIVNSGIRRHNMVILVDGVEQASPEVRPGDVVEWSPQIERPGRYLFWCGEYRHLEKGMTGILTVK